MGALESAVARVSSPVFVGRGEELGRLHAGLAAASAGRPGMVLVAGEAGVGKSRLVEWFAEQAERTGAQVAVGGAAPMTSGLGALPYGSLLQVRVIGDQQESGAGWVSDELARVLDELTAHLPAGSQPYGAEAGQGRLFERLSALLDRLSQQVPLLLVLEDLHWADAGTLDFLAYQLRLLRRQRLLLIGTYRLEDPGDRLLGWLAEARRSRLVSWLELARFTRAELADLLVGMRGGPVDGRVVLEVFDRSGGNAFFAEELYTAGIGAGADRLPRLLREVLLARVRGLSPAAQRLPAAMAVVLAAGPARHHLLLAVLGGSDDELVGALREAIGCGLLQVSPPDEVGQQRYGFRHVLVQEAVYHDLLPGERARLHEACARALSLEPNDQRPLIVRFPGEQAEHWYRAGRPAEALVWTLRAVDAAQRVYAHAEAARSCERALQLWDQAPDTVAGTGTDRIGLHMRAARAWENAGGDARSLPHVDAALREVDPAADPVRAGLLHQLRSWYHTDVAEILAASREAVRLVPAEPPSAERAQVLWAHGRNLATKTSQYAEAETVLEEALTAARRAGSRPDIARAMASLGYLQATTGRTDAGIALLSEACASNEWLVEDGWGLAMAQGLLSETLAMANRLDEAARVAMGGWKTQCTNLGLREHRYAYGLLGRVVEALFELGRWADAARICQARAHRPVSASTMAMQLSVAELEAARGQGGAALARLDDLGRVCPSTPRYRREVGQRRAELLLWLGRPQEAVTEVRLVLDAVAGTGQEWLAGRVACLGMRAIADMAELAWARRDLSAAAAVRGSADELIGRVTGLAHDPFDAQNPLRATAPAERALWEAERSRLDDTPHPAGWQAACEAWQRLGRPYRVAYCQWRQAEALLAAGDTGRARDALRAAHTTTVELGAAPLRAEVESLALRARISLSAAEPRSVAPVRPYDLTDRELAVLRLLADGHTNREIGQQLFISPKTASVHVTNILRKLAVRDRVQAATVAVRSGLVDAPTTVDG